MENNTVYRYIGGSQEDGILACGYMEKGPQKSQIDFCIPYYSVFLLLEGSGSYWDETGFTAALGPGSIVQRLPGRVHSTRVDPDRVWREFFISFGAGSHYALLGLKLLQTALPVVHGPLRPGLLQECDRLLRGLKSVGGLRELQQAQALAVALFQPEARSPVEQAKSLLSADLRQPITERQAAAQTGLGVENFRKLFKKAVGLSPMEFRNRQKLMTAQLMLLGGSSVKDTALSLGYSDAYSFSKQFKKLTGIAPALWKGAQAGPENGE